MRTLVIVVFILLPFSLIGQSEISKTIENGEDLIREMHARYSTNWYQHLTFKQDMYRYRDDSLIRNEIWLVAYSSPCKLHIRYKDFDSGRGWLIINDTIHSYNHNQLIGKRPRLHELMILGFDVYSVSPEQVIPKIYKMNFDLSKVSLTSINGKPVYQVGDPSIHCFWVHQDDLLFYGVRKVGEMGVRDTFFEHYKMFYGKPVATQVQYFQDGSLYLFEKYSEIRLPTSLPESFFDPALFNDIRW